MAYTKQTWNPLAAGGTLITADRLNHIEDGIFDAAADADAAVAGVPTDLNDLADVNVSSPVGGQMLAYNASTSKWEGGAGELDALADVDMTGAADGDLLVYDASVSMVKPSSIAVPSDLDDLSDVNLTGAIEGDWLRLVGGFWVPFTPPTPTVMQSVQWVIPGAFAVSTGKLRFYNDSGATRTISAIRMEVGTAPGSGDVIVDVNKGGVTLFTTQSRRPTSPTSDIADASTALPNITSWEAGSFLTMDVDAIGTGAVPTDLVVTVTFS